MKPFYLTLALAISQCCNLFAQAPATNSYTCNFEPNEEVLAPGFSSENGLGHSPNGNLHLMFIAVTFLEDDIVVLPDNLSAFWPTFSIFIY